ncbi:GNAT family N-acetyltransferase [Candidatus Gracilibacteria bacterium]|nr:GNAT family N-acetyltransferase [Candidatus Gracilibacteria bacterium]
MPVVTILLIFRFLKTIARSLIPENFSYYRTGSRVFYEYYKKYTNLVVEKTGKGYEFFRAFRVFPGFYSVINEKNDTELTTQILKKSGISHGIIWWTPSRIMQKPKGWLRLPTWFAKRDIHASRSAFSILDTQEYWNKWSSKARSHRRHVIENIDSVKIQIRADENLERFLDLYRSTRIHDPNKVFVDHMTKKLFANTESPYRIYIAYVDGIPLAGALFIDEGVTSEYWASFYHSDSRPYHLGIAIMDRWFLDSYKKSIQYCDLDHMQDDGQSSGYAGYTEFKSSIADYDVYFHDMWIKIF